MSSNRRRHLLSHLGALGWPALLAGCWLVSSVGDLPTVGAPSSEAGAGGPSLCSAGGFLFCDGFENGLGAWSMIANGGALLTVDSAHVYRGSLALHVRLPPGSTQELDGELSHSQSWPAPVFARFFAYVHLQAPGPFPPNATSLLLFNQTSPVEGVGIYVTGSQPAGSLSTFGVPMQGGPNTGPLPLDQWVCFELEADGNNATVWVDGTGAPATSFPVSPTSLGLFLGLTYHPQSASDPTYEAWFDEIAVAGTRIGCER